jgi:hypothetical protein
LRLSEGGAGTRRPRLEFDHVQIAVEDLDAAIDRFAREYGLLARVGGRHPGRGTGNAIVPLGDSYLELIAVLDDAEARPHPTSRRVGRAVGMNRTFAAWAARTGDLGQTLTQLGDLGLQLPERHGVEGRRRRTDGVELAWRSADLVSDGEFSPLPFLIEWRVPLDEFPGALSTAHPSGARGVLALRLSEPAPDQAMAQLRPILHQDIEYSVQSGEPGIAEVVLDTPTGPLILR